MSSEYIKRRDVAAEIASRLKEHTIGTIIVGSVAYSPGKVNVDTEVDIVSVADLRLLNCEETRASLRLDKEKFFPSQIPEKIDVLGVNWQYNKQILVGCYFWDKDFFSRVVQFAQYNLVTRLLHYSSSKNMKSLVMTNLRGGNYIQIPTPLYAGLSGESKEWQRFLYRAYDKKRNDLFLGISVVNLLLSPRVLQDSQDGILQQSFSLFRDNLKRVILETYGSSRGGDISILNALPEKTRKKLPPKLYNDLRDSF